MNREGEGEGEGEGEIGGIYLDDGDVGEVDRDVEGGEEREALGHGQSGSRHGWMDGEAEKDRRNKKP